MRTEELKTAKTESRFRDVNERIAESAEQFGIDELALVCECADPECGQQIDAPVDEYEELVPTAPTSSSRQATRSPGTSA